MAEGPHQAPGYRKKSRADSDAHHIHAVLLATFNPVEMLADWA
jgi:hypothetical protein